MSPQSRDPWRLPVLDRFGAQLRELERADAARRRRRRVSISGGLVAALVAAFALLDMGQLAHALSPVNRAPAAAAASESVRFHSTITIAVNGRQQKRFTEHGEIDFARRNYRTTLQLGHGEAIEQRRVDGVLYIAQLPGGRSQHAPIRWHAVPARARSLHDVRVSSRKRGVHEPPGAAGRAWRHPRSGQGRGHGRPRRRTDDPLSARRPISRPS